MNRGMLAIAVIALICASAAGIGYAATTYTGTTYTDSDVDYQQYSIVLTDISGGAVSNALSFDRPVYTTPVLVDGHYETTVTAASKTSDPYKLKITCPENVESLNARCVVTLADTRSWAIIDSITVEVCASDVDVATYTYTLDPSTETSTSVTIDDVVIPYDTWNADQSPLMTLNKTDHNFVKITVAYKAVTLKYDEDDVSFMDLTGMKVIFSAATADPSPAVASP